MKTNVIMKSNDRDLFGVTIPQETKTGFLSLSALQKAYDKEAELKGWANKRIDHIFLSKSNIERIYYILYEQKKIPQTQTLKTFVQNAEDYGFFKYLKKIGVYKTSGARTTKVTWCNPYLWLLVSLELHPVIYAQVVLWLADKLLINRIEAGNMYIGLAKSVTKLNGVDYVRLAKALNHIVFRKHETGLRNSASQADLKKLEQLESNLSFMIDMGTVNDFEHLMRVCEQKYKLSLEVKNG